MKPLISRAFVALAAALSITLAIFSVVAGVWPLGLIHAFVSIVLLGAYLRPMDFDVWDEVHRANKPTPEFDS